MDNNVGFNADAEFENEFSPLNENVVQNIIVADNKKATEKALNCTLIEISNENPASAGWIYDGEKFIAPQVIDETLAE